MCLVVFAYRVHRDYELIVLANRDEFHARPSGRLQRWPQGFYAGRDEQAGGSWLGLHPEGRFAALTNVREGPPKVSPRSRGELVAGFLADPAWQPPSAIDKARDYSGFNLLTAHCQQGEWHLRFSSNRYAERDLAPGVYGLSNGDLDSDWPKIQRAKQAFDHVLKSGTTPSLDWLSALSDRNRASDEALPNTGIGLAKERWLSPCFIVSPGYGTVSSTVVCLSAQQNLIAERRYDATGAVSEENVFQWPNTLQR